jgi:aconitase A
VLFGRTVPAPLPDVVGYELVGQLNSLATSTDLVLTITKVCFQGRVHSFVQLSHKHLVSRQ